MVAPAPDPNSVIYHSCGKAGYYKSDCAVPGKSNNRLRSDHLGKSRKLGAKTVDTTSKLCSLNKTTSYSFADCYKHGVSGMMAGALFFVVFLGSQSVPSENDKKLPITFSDDIDGGFQS